MSNPRIISGKAKGMRLQGVPGNITRPITDRVKEALFNIIGSDIENASLLDLFAGTGSVGIEALSRGASFVHLNDIHRLAITTIRANLEHTRLKENAKVTQQDAFTLLSTKPHQPFDYIFIAPPQYKNLWKEILLKLDQNINWLADDGWVIVQIDPVEYENLIFNHLTEFEQRRYGSTLLLFFEKRKP
ncbi:MAG: 16S rRNA (guanine(966)-N(2))-methyltransferase RsmD [Chloroflexota bacterium]|nr:MAG: RNA methyltransferase [Bellilinea sp.]